MSLSTGPNSQKFAFDLQGLRTLYQTNQVKGIDSAKGVGNGIPLHVTDVKASTANASSGLTNVTTVTFRRNPADPNFQRANVYVQGYNSSQAPVLVVSSADSPATVVLNNTGESIRVIVQAAGNGGAALLSTAPTTGIQLPKSTAGGFSTTTQTSASVPANTVVSNGATPLDGQVLEYLSVPANWGPRWATPFQFGCQPFGGGTGLLAPGTWGMTNLAIGGTGVANAFVAPTATNPAGVTVGTNTNNPGFANIFNNVGTTAHCMTLGILRRITIRLKLTQTTNCRVWLGLSDNVTQATFASDAPAATIVGFRMHTGTDAKYQCVTQTGAASQTINPETTATHLDTSIHYFTIEWDGTNVFFYIDGVQVGKQNTNTNTATAVSPFIALDNLASAANQSFTFHGLRGQLTFN